MFENMTKAFVDMKNVGLLFMNCMYIMVKITHGILVSTMYLKTKSFQDMFTKQIKQILHEWLFCFLHVCLFVFPHVVRRRVKMDLYGELKGFMCLLVCIGIITSILTGYEHVFNYC